MKTIRWLLACFLLMAGAANAATVVFDTQTFTGTANNRPITVRLITQGFANGTNLVFGTPITIVPVSGTATRILLPGNYTAEFNQHPVAYPFSVPDSTNTYNLIDLVNRGIYMMSFSGIASNAIDVVAGNNITIQSNGFARVIASTGGGGGVAALTPWTSTINGNQQSLTNADVLDGTFVFASAIMAAPQFVGGLYTGAINSTGTNIFSGSNYFSGPVVFEGNVDFLTTNTLTTLGDLSVTGTVTAAHLIGDGSGITGVIAAGTNTSGGLQITNEFWIQKEANAGGNGTLASPASATTVGFDTIVSSLATNTHGCSIHIMPGTYDTGGNAAWKVPPHFKIIGSGMDVTILRLTNGAAYGSYVLDARIGAGDLSSNVFVGDLTLDANGANNASNLASGLQIFGSDSTVQRVKVINLIGNYGTGNESFGFHVGPAASDGSGADHNSGNTIQDCEVSSVLGDHCSAITMTGGGAILNNRIYFQIVTNPAFAGSFMGINVPYARSVRVIGNQTFGGNYGFYSDTGACTNIIVSDNIFRDSTYGMVLNNPSGVSGINFNNNRVYITTTGSGASSNRGFQCATKVYDLMFYGNHLSGGSGASIIYLDGVTNATFSGNIWDDTKTISQTNVSGITWKDNFGLNGAYITNLVQAGTADIFLNVKNFGARGNGTTDDTAAIQSALNYISGNTNNLVVIHFPPGVYKSGQLFVRPNVANGGNGGFKLLGAGINVSRLEFTNLTAGQIGICATNIGIYDHFSIESLTLDGPQLATPTMANTCIGVAVGVYGNYTWAGNNILFKDCGIYGFGYGTTLSNLWGVTIDNCQYYSNKVEAIRSSGTHNVFVKNSLINSSPDFAATGIGFHLPSAGGAGDNALVEGTVIYNCTNAVYNDELNLTIIGGHFGYCGVYIKATGNVYNTFIGTYILDPSISSPWTNGFPALIEANLYALQNMHLFSPFFDSTRYTFYQTDDTFPYVFLPMVVDGQGTAALRASITSPQVNTTLGTLSSGGDVSFGASLSMAANAYISWPTSAATPGAYALVNSNGTPYVLVSSPSGTAWTATNLIGGASGSGSATNVTLRASASIGVITNATADWTPFLTAGASNAFWLSTVNVITNGATGTSSDAMGTSAIASGNSATAVGDGASALGLQSTSIGRQSDAQNTDDTALGYRASAEGTNSTAIGTLATVANTHSNSTAIGKSATTTKASQVMLGTSAETVTVPGNSELLGTSNYVSGNFTVAGAQLTVSNTISAAGVNASSGDVYANRFFGVTASSQAYSGHGGGLTNLTGANVVGAVPEATHATNADTSISTTDTGTYWGGTGTNTLTLNNKYYYLNCATDTAITNLTVSGGCWAVLQFNNTNAATTIHAYNAVSGVFTNNGNNMTFYSNTNGLVIPAGKCGYFSYLAIGVHTNFSNSVQQ